MKRKQIEKIAVLQPTKKGKYITTVQKMDNILILNVFVDGELRGRHALDPETGEYSQYLEKGWKKRKYASLLDIDTSPGGYYWLEDTKRAVFDTQEQEQIVKDALGMAKKITWHRNTYDMIDEAEKQWNQNMRERTECNRVRRVQDKMNLVPKLPEGIRDWIWQQEGAEDFVFLNKDSRKWTCTSCGKSYEERRLKRTGSKKGARHNDMVTCPECGKIVMAKKRVQDIEKKSHFAILQKIDSRMSAFRTSK